MRVMLKTPPQLNLFLSFAGKRCWRPTRLRTLKRDAASGALRRLAGRFGQLRVYLAGMPGESIAPQASMRDDRANDHACRLVDVIAACSGSLLTNRPGKIVTLGNLPS